MQEKKQPRTAPLNAGKLPELMLKRSVLRKLHPETSPDCRQYYGSGCPQWNSGSDLLFSSVCEVPGSDQNPGRLVTAAANHLYADGAVPAALLVQAVFPEGCTEPEIQAAMKAVREAAGQEKMEILGGHTQISKDVLRPLISITGIGEVRARRRPLKPGDILLATKWIGLGGTAALAAQNETELKQYFSSRFVEAALSLERHISIKNEAEVLDQISEGEAKAAYAVSQGGIFGALREMAEHADVGLQIDLRMIPIRQETIEICEYFDINPYELYGSGALIIGASPETAGHLEEAYRQREIPCARIGEATAQTARILRNGEEQRYLDRAPRDAWYR